MTRQSTTAELSQEELTPEEVEWLAMGPRPGGTPGLVRRIRRRLDVSQRGLAALLGVSQSAVARWETGRTSPRVSTLERLLELAGLTTRVHDEDGAEAEPMRDDGARDRRGRRFPAHVDLEAQNWWVPPGSERSAAYTAWTRSSRETGVPAVRYHTSRWRRHVERRLRGTPVDHPALHQLATEVRWTDEKHEDRGRVTRERLERVRRAWGEELRSSA